jgi:NodT family efflux transporter outer membrane factor (OMF) lipoprotein
MNGIIKISVMTLCIISQVSCSAMRSEYQAPQLVVPHTWSQVTVAQPSDTDTDVHSNKAVRLARPNQWWTLFQDPELNHFIDRVLASNSELALATLTLRKALVAAGLSENNKVPTLSFSQSSAYEYDLDSGTSDKSSSMGLSLSYELDLWDRIDALADASDLAARASYEERETLAQDLVVTAATLYWSVGYLNEKLALVKDNLQDSQRIAELVGLQFDNGANTQLEVVESKQAVFALQLQISQIEQQLSEAENAIAILLNQPLQASGFSIAQLPRQRLPDIVAGLPADILLRRPDIKASLYQLQASLAAKDAVDASYLPTITLTGALNTSSSSLFELLQNPVAKLGSGLVLPFLEWREMALNKESSQIDYEMAVVNYRDTIYQAFEEVDNLLTAKKHYVYQLGVYQSQFDNALEIERLYQSKYTYGDSDIIDWLNAMASRRNIQSSLLESRYNQFVVQARLYQSLGGGDIVL